MADRIFQSQRIDATQVTIRRTSSYNHDKLKSTISSPPMARAFDVSNRVVEPISEVEIAHHVNRHKEMLQKSTIEQVLASPKSKNSSNQTSPMQKISILSQDEDAQ